MAYTAGALKLPWLILRAFGAEKWPYVGFKYDRILKVIDWCFPESCTRVKTTVNPDDKCEHRFNVLSHRFRRGMMISSAVKSGLWVVISAFIIGMAAMLTNWIMAGPVPVNLIIFVVLIVFAPLLVAAYALLLHGWYWPGVQGFAGFD